MKYLILAPDDKRIIHISDTLGYQENGNYLIYGGSLAIPPTICELAEVDTVPDDVVPERWCYKNGAFASNPNWNPPTSSGDADELIRLIEGGAVDGTDT